MLVGSPGSQPCPPRSRVSPTSVLRKSGIDTNVKSGSSAVGAIGTAAARGAANETGSMSRGAVRSHAVTPMTAASPEANQTMAGSRRSARLNLMQHESTEALREQPT